MLEAFGNVALKAHRFVLDPPLISFVTVGKLCISMSQCPSLENGDYNYSY